MGITDPLTPNTLIMTTDIIMMMVTIVSLAKVLSGTVNIKGRADTLSLASITTTVTEILQQSKGIQAVSFGVRYCQNPICSSTRRTGSREVSGVPIQNARTTACVPIPPSVPESSLPCCALI